MQKENFLESAPRCNGVHLQGEGLDPLEMNLNAKGELFTATPGTGFFGSTASLTKEKTRRVGGANTESLCASNKVQKPLTVCVERGYLYIYIYMYINIDVYINISSFNKTHKKNDESSKTLRPRTNNKNLRMKFSAPYPCAILKDSRFER